MSVKGKKKNDGCILKDTRLLIINNGIQIHHLKLVLKEMMNLTQRLQIFRPDAGLLHDIAGTIGHHGNWHYNNRLISDNEHCDAMLTIEGASVICCGIRPKSIDKYAPSVGFVCGRMYDPGVYRYSDGSGEPPSEDFSEEFETKSPREAAIYLMKTILDIELSQVAQSLNEDEMVKQIKEDAKEVF